MADLRLYANKLAQAQGEWQDNNDARALAILDECQWNLRNIEHRYLWTLSNSKGQEVLTLKGNTGIVSSVAVSPNGKHIVSGSVQTVKVWEAETGPEVLTIHTGFVNSVAVSPDGKRIVSGSGDGTVKVWNAETGKEVLTLKGPRD